MATTASTLHNHATGPRTEAGKAISSQNALKHGLAAGILFLPTENPADFHLLHEGLRADHQPQGTTEDLLVADMARHHWLMDRAIRLQTLALVRNDFSKLDLFLRYQTSNHRAFHKSLATLLLLRKQFVSKSTAAPDRTTRNILVAQPAPLQIHRPEPPNSVPAAAATRQNTETAPPNPS